MITSRQNNTPRCIHDAQGHSHPSHKPRWSKQPTSKLYFLINSEIKVTFFKNKNKKNLNLNLY